ncbi:hypothetical protein DIPPA_07024 [Diplonema papillatum]|nr:hypothetical protein DIPPA_07024 [Diplonema papillatum]
MIVPYDTRMLGDDDAEAALLVDQLVATQRDGGSMLSDETGPAADGEVNQLLKECTGLRRALQTLADASSQQRQQDSALHSYPRLDHEPAPPYHSSASSSAPLGQHQPHPAFYHDKPDAKSKRLLRDRHPNCHSNTVSNHPFAELRESRGYYPTRTSQTHTAYPYPNPDAGLGGGHAFAAPAVDRRTLASLSARAGAAVLGDSAFDFTSGARGDDRGGAGGGSAPAPGEDEDIALADALTPPESPEQRGSGGASRGVAASPDQAKSSRLLAEIAGEQKVFDSLVDRIETVISGGRAAAKGGGLPPAAEASTTPPSTPPHHEPPRPAQPQRRRPPREAARRVSFNDTEEVFEITPPHRSSPPPTHHRRPRRSRGGGSPGAARPRHAHQPGEGGVPRADRTLQYPSDDTGGDTPGGGRRRRGEAGRGETLSKREKRITEVLQRLEGEIGGNGSGGSGAGSGSGSGGGSGRDAATRRSAAAPQQGGSDSSGETSNASASEPGGVATTADPQPQPDGGGGAGERSGGVQPGQSSESSETSGDSGAWGLGDKKKRLLEVHPSLLARQRHTMIFGRASGTDPAAPLVAHSATWAQDLVPQTSDEAVFSHPFQLSDLESRLRRATSDFEADARAVLLELERATRVGTSLTRRLSEPSGDELHYALKEALGHAETELSRVLKEKGELETALDGMTEELGEWREKECRAREKAAELKEVLGRCRRAVFVPSRGAEEREAGVVAADDSVGSEGERDEMLRRIETVMSENRRLQGEAARSVGKEKSSFDRHFADIERIRGQVTQLLRSASRQASYLSQQPHYHLKLQPQPSRPALSPIFFAESPQRSQDAAGQSGLLSLQVDAAQLSSTAIIPSTPCSPPPAGAAEIAECVQSTYSASANAYSDDLDSVAGDPMAGGAPSGESVSVVLSALQGEVEELMRECEVNGLELECLVLVNHELRTELETLQTERDCLRSKLEGAETDASAILEEHTETLKAEATLELESIITEMTNSTEDMAAAYTQKIAGLLQDVDDRSARLQSEIARSSNLEHEKKSLLQDLRRLSAALASLQEQNNERTARVKAVEGDHLKLQKKVREMESEHRTLIAALEVRAQEAKGERAKYSAMRASFEEKEASFAAKLDREVSKLKRSLATADGTAGGMRDRIDQLEEHRAALRSDLNTAAAAIAGLHSQRLEQHVELEAEARDFTVKIEAFTRICAWQDMQRTVAHAQLGDELKSQSERAAHWKTRWEALEREVRDATGEAAGDPEHAQQLESARAAAEEARGRLEADAAALRAALDRKELQLAETEARLFCLEGEHEALAAAAALQSTRARGELSARDEALSGSDGRLEDMRRSAAEAVAVERQKADKWKAEYDQRTAECRRLRGEIDRLKAQAWGSPPRTAPPDGEPGESNPDLCREIEELVAGGIGEGAADAVVERARELAEKVRFLEETASALRAESRRLAESCRAAEDACAARMQAAAEEHAQAADRAHAALKEARETSRLAETVSEARIQALQTNVDDAAEAGERLRAELASATAAQAALAQDLERENAARKEAVLLSSELEDDLLQTIEQHQTEALLFAEERERQAAALGQFEEIFDLAVDFAEATVIELSMGYEARLDAVSERGADAAGTLQVQVEDLAATLRTREDEFNAELESALSARDELADTHRSLAADLAARDRECAALRSEVAVLARASSEKSRVDSELDRTKRELESLHASQKTLLSTVAEMEAAAQVRDDETGAMREAQRMLSEVLDEKAAGLAALEAEHRAVIEKDQEATLKPVVIQAMVRSSQMFLKTKKQPDSSSSRRVFDLSSLRTSSSASTFKSEP